MENIKLAPHEAIEVREFIGQEMLGIKKVTASMNMVSDNELKSFMQDSVASMKTVLRNMQTVLK